MITTAIAARVARLERLTGGGGTCPWHDVAIGVRYIEAGVMTITSEPGQRPCRRCGQPATAFWVDLTVVPNRQREELGR